jgi:hypothetical protein
LYWPSSWFSVGGFCNIKERREITHLFKGTSGLVVKVSASQPGDHGLESYFDYSYVSSYDTTAGRFQEANSKVINVSCKNNETPNYKVLFIYISLSYMFSKFQ